MKKRKILALILTVIMVASVLIGCSNGNEEKPPANSGSASNETEEPSNSDNEATDEPTGKDKLIVIVGTDVSQFSPYITNSFTDIMALYQVYERLVYFVDGEPVPQLAESWTVSDDGLTYTFKIRPNTTFHNGEPCTAEDIAWSISRNLDRPRSASSKAKYKSIKALDADTLEIVLEYPVPSILSNLASPTMGVICKSYVEQDEENAFLNPVGTGAYKLKKWTKGSKIEFERFEEYSGKPAGIKYLTFNIIGDSSTALVSLETGHSDFIVNVSEANLAIVEKSDILDYKTAPSHTTSTVVFNIRTGLLENQKLRQAIAHAIDRESINIIAYEETGTLATGSYPDFLGYSGKDFSYEYDLEKAKQLMAEAGYPDGGLELTIKTADYYGDVIPQIIQEDLREIGIDLKIEMLELNAHSQDYLNANFEIIFAGGSSITPDLGEVLFSSYYWPDNTWSPSAPDDDRFNEKLLAIRYETDHDKRTGLIDEVMQELYELSNEVPLITKVSNVVFAKGLKGIYVDPNGMFYCFKDFNW